MNLQEQLRTIRHDLYAHRNGVVADALRKAGDPHRVISGCQLADIKQVTQSVVPDCTLALTLWNDIHHRESRLAAIMLMPQSEFTIDMAREWMESLVSHEEADVLAWRLLQHMEYAPSLLNIDAERPNVQYCLNRLAGWLNSD